MGNERFYVSKGKIRDKQKPKDWFTVKEVCALLNKQDKDLQLCVKTLRAYDGKWLFDGSILTFADVLNKVLHDEKEQ